MLNVTNLDELDFLLLLDQNVSNFWNIEWYCVILSNIVLLMDHQSTAVILLSSWSQSLIISFKSSTWRTGFIPLPVGLKWRMPHYCSYESNFYFYSKWTECAWPCLKHVANSRILGVHISWRISFKLVEVAVQWISLVNPPNLWLLRDRHCSHLVLVTVVKNHIKYLCSYQCRL